MYYQDIDMEHQCSVFIEEMEKGLSGDESSLKMIPTYLETDKEIPAGERIIALDAGGTNFRVATIYFKENGEPVIENYKRYPMPGVKEEVTKNLFFQIASGFLEEVIDKSGKIGFCFSYPTEMLPSKDGRLLKLTKEIKAKELLGEKIGENLSAAFRKRGWNKEKKIIILNDTAAAILAGKAFARNRVYDNYVGFILGTGTNCCYIEKNENILKKQCLKKGGSQIINVESGGYGKAPRGKMDIDFDNKTINPGEYTFEKMISGAYLGGIVLHTLKTAACDGFFSEKTEKNILSLEGINTEHVNGLLHYPDCNSNPLTDAFLDAAEDERIIALYIAECIIERAAKLTAINISSIIQKTGSGIDPCSPVCISADGTTFFKLKSFKQKVEYYLRQYLEKEHMRFFEIVHIENAPIIGAASAALTN